ncbi:MAG: SH3 domain-containing protein [Bacteroidales bacterium]|nr:SH3 domain-containing protein [Bacteroidales bacterium]
MNRTINAVMLLLGLSMMVSCGGNNQGKTENKETNNTITQAQQETMVVEESKPVDNRPRVYACAYDAYVNIRETPKAQAPILGVFKNGPEGAVLLGTEGEWTKIDCNGIVGYVFSKYLQDTPTVAYTGEATLDDIAGVYFGGEFGGMYIWDDGTWDGGYNDLTYSGTWILQNNEVKLIPLVDFDFDKYEPIVNDAATVEAKSELLQIDLAHHKIGTWERAPFITKQEIDKARKEFEKGEYGTGERAWEEFIDMTFYGFDIVHRMTKEDFKKKKYR